MTIWGLYKGVRGKKTGGKHRAKYKKVQSCLSLVRSENSFEHYTRMTQKRLKAFVYQVYSLYLYNISSRKSTLKKARKNAIFKEVQYINLWAAA